LRSGGREYAFAWKFLKDKEVQEVYCAPGNGGTKVLCTNLDLDINDHKKVLDAIKQLNIDLTVVGPEAPLADGIVDYLESNGVRVFGPDQYASQLESSKLFARDIMDQHNIPQPRYKKCSSIDEANNIKNSWGLPLVVKADGLAAGKGVILCEDEKSFSDAMDVMFENPQFGEASREISVEECLFGEELSVFAVCDGESYKILNTAQDHKRIFDNDKGPNTGGMGAYSPTPLSTHDIILKTEQRIVEPILNAMRDRGHPYKGFLYVGVMIVDGEPYVIEFNVRMGDPETQVVIPLMESSLYRLLDDCV
jgi:phosphoribosylamine--glycine ligase